MNLYIMRHSTTNANEKCICQGRTQGRLSKKGVQLVSARAEEFKDTPIDLIICSPLCRTVQTAKIMNKHHNVKIIKHPLLNELDQGVFTGKSKYEITQEEHKLRTEAKKSGAPNPYGIESFASVLNRAAEFAAYLKREKPAENILVVTHNVVASLLLNVLENKATDLYDDSQVCYFKNAEIRKIII